jgi:hypothetical protein
MFLCRKHPQPPSRGAQPPSSLIPNQRARHPLTATPSPQCCSRSQPRRPLPPSSQPLLPASSQRRGRSQLRRPLPPSPQPPPPSAAAAPISAYTSSHRCSPFQRRHPRDARPALDRDMAEATTRDMAEGHGQGPYCCCSTV